MGQGRTISKKHSFCISIHRNGWRHIDQLSRHTNIRRGYFRRFLMIIFWMLPFSRTIAIPFQAELISLTYQPTTITLYTAWTSPVTSFPSMSAGPAPLSSPWFGISSGSFCRRGRDHADKISLITGVSQVLVQLSRQVSRICGVQNVPRLKVAQFSTGMQITEHPDAGNERKSSKEHVMNCMTILCWD